MPLYQVLPDDERLTPRHLQAYYTEETQLRLKSSLCSMREDAAFLDDTRGSLLVALAGPINPEDMAHTEYVAGVPLYFCKLRD